MQNNETAKTKSAPKQSWSAIVIAVVLVVALAVGLPRLGHGVVTLKIPDSEMQYKLKQLTTAEQQQRGLSGTEQLPAKEGMLFVYENEREICMWMKDMQYAIDMIWLDAGKKVTAIEHFVSPETYPERFCHDGKYVIEIGGDQTLHSGIREGQVLSF